MGVEIYFGWFFRRIIDCVIKHMTFTVFFLPVYYISFSEVRDYFLLYLVTAEDTQGSLSIISFNQHGFLRPILIILD